jgi:hypothetical protein
LVAKVLGLLGKELEACLGGSWKCEAGAGCNATVTDIVAVKSDIWTLFSWFLRRGGREGGTMRGILEGRALDDFERELRGVLAGIENFALAGLEG